MRRERHLGFGRTALVVATLCLAAPAATVAQGLVPSQVADVRPGGGDSSPSDLVAAGNQLFFEASGDPALGNELYRTDGTAAGTTLVRDITPGPNGSFLRFFTALGDSVVFASDDETNTIGEEVWASDGTAAGTTPLKDIRPGPAGSSPGRFAAFNGFLYFSANDGTNGAELWRTDGTPAGTTMVANINPTAGEGSNPGGTDGTAVLGNFLYFRANDGTNGTELWRTDGTPAGTTPVANINPTAGAGSFPDDLTVFNGALYFEASNGTTGTELWRSDGTGAGTTPVANINPGPNAGSFPGPLTASGGLLYFSADDGSAGTELWRSDGTGAGTALVADINPGPEDSDPSDIVPLNGGIVFDASNNEFNRELHRSDGTGAGTAIVKEIAPSEFEGALLDSLVPFGGLVYFSASDRDTGEELWRTDGTAAGTARLADVNPGGNDFDPDDLTPFQGTLFFSGEDSVTGRELWRLAEPPPPAVDAKAPVLTVETPAKTKLKRTLIVDVSCDEACEISGTGKVVAKPPKKGKLAPASRAKKQRFKLSGPTVSLAAGTQGELALSLSKKNFKKAKEAKSAGAKLSAQITITAKDAATNASDRALKLKLR